MLRKCLRIIPKSVAGYAVTTTLLLIISLCWCGCERLASEDSQPLPEDAMGRSPLDDILHQVNAIPTSVRVADLNIQINPMEEFDGLTRREVFDRRRQVVASQPLLNPQSYHPSEQVFGQIVDGKPWWGSLGLSFYGPGRNVTEGPSEESRFVLNPYLLVGIDLGSASVAASQLPPLEILPRAISLRLRTDWSSGYARYDMSSVFSKGSRYWGKDPRHYFLRLIAYNARDFGFPFGWPDPAGSQNVRFLQAATSPIHIPDFIHFGRSCGYNDGCNNMSPEQKQLNFQITPNLPARVSMKLWRNRPSDPNTHADCLFVIDLQ